MHASKRAAFFSFRAIGPKRLYSVSSNQPVDSRWLGQTSSRLGKCITFGLNESQIKETGAICKELAEDWRELIAGSEGYLTGKGRRGLWRQHVVWGEMDSMYVRYSESGRVEWARNYAKTIDPAHEKEWEQTWSSRGIGMILRSIKTDFKFPMTYPDRVTVFHKLQALPEGSHDAFFLEVLMFSERHRRPVARCVEDIVIYDYRKGTKTNLDAAPFMLDAFRETFRLQEQAAATNQERVQSISDRVRALETTSWDRADAVEKFGSVKA